MSVWRYLTYLIYAVLFGAGVMLGLWVSVLISTKPYIYPSIQTLPDAQVALVLGASVTINGNLSQVFTERVDEAMALYRAGKVKKILVTGDDSSPPYDEVDPVGRYMVAQGIPKADIFLDHAGFDTYSSMYRARDVFDVSSMIIVSQPFHLPRSVFIARALGLNATAIGASEGESYIYNTLREIPATAKAMFDIVFSRVPKYLGQQYPVSGDGAATWGGATTTPQ